MHAWTRTLLAWGLAGGTLTVAASATAGGEDFQRWMQQDREAWRAFQGSSGGASNRAAVRAHTPVPVPAAMRTDPVPGVSGNRLEAAARLPAGERIFFTRTHNIQGVDYGDIYSMAPDGSDVQQLTAFSQNFYYTDYPQLSRDGRSLVFVSNYEGWKSANYKDAFLLDVTSGRFRRITGDERPTPPQQTGQVEVQVDAAPLTRLSFKGCTTCYDPAQTTTLTVPGGETIWVKAEKQLGVGDVAFVYVPVNGDETVQLDMRKGTVQVDFASPSPDGSLVAVSSSVMVGAGGDVCSSVGMWRADGTAMIQQYVGGPQRAGGDGGAVFSPDGSRIAYAAGAPARTGIGVLSTANLSVPPTMVVPGIFTNPNMSVSPSWSPDGTLLAFIYGSTDVVTYHNFNIYRVPAAGGNPVAVSATGGGCWTGMVSCSPDGKRLAFSLVQPGGRSDIWVMPAEGGPAVALTRDGCSRSPCWGVVRK